jgi:hypothetical protein
VNDFGYAMTGAFAGDENVRQTRSVWKLRDHSISKRPFVGCPVVSDKAPLPARLMVPVGVF